MDNETIELEKYQWTFYCSKIHLSAKFCSHFYVFLNKNCRRTIVVGNILCNNSTCIHTYVYTRSMCGCKGLKNAAEYKVENLYCRFPHLLYVQPILHQWNSYSLIFMTLHKYTHIASAHGMHKHIPSHLCVHLRLNQ